MLVFRVNPLSYFENVPNIKKFQPFFCPSSYINVNYDAKFSNENFCLLFFCIPRHFE